jgi:molybdate-binding protein
VKKFIEVIKSDKLHKKLDELGGYGYSNTGKILNID